MATIKNLSAFDTESEFAQTQENYPSLMHFFQCKETGGQTLTDAVTGATIATAATITVPAANCVSANITAGTVPIGGSIADTGSKDLLFFIVGDFSSIGGLTIGSLSGQNIINQNGQFVSTKTLDDGVTTVTNSAAAVSSDTVVGSAVSCELGSATGLQAHEVDSTGYAVLTPAGSADISAITTMSLDNAMGSSGMTRIYGIALFAFDSLPDDLENALNWMYYQWQQGNKVVWPQWQGLS